MKYFILLMTLVLSSCSNNHQVNDGWVIYDLRPLQGGRVMYYAEDERISIFKHNRIIKFVGSRHSCSIRSVSTTKNRYRFSPCGCRGRNRTSKNRDLAADNCLNIFKSSSYFFLQDTIFFS